MGEEEAGVSCRIFEEFERLGMIVENLNIMREKRKKGGEKCRIWRRFRQQDKILSKTKNICFVNTKHMSKLSSPTLLISVIAGSKIVIPCKKAFGYVVQK